MDSVTLAQTPYLFLPRALKNSIVSNSLDRESSDLGQSIVNFHKNSSPKESLITVGDRVISKRYPYMLWFMPKSSQPNLIDSQHYKKVLDDRGYAPMKTFGIMGSSTVLNERKEFVVLSTNSIYVGGQKNLTEGKLIFSFKIWYPTPNYLLLSFLSFLKSSQTPVPINTSPSGIKRSDFDIDQRNTTTVFEPKKDYCITSFLYNHFHNKTLKSVGNIVYQLDKDMMKKVRFLPGEEFFHFIYPSLVQVVGAFELQSKYPFVHSGGWVETKHWLGGVIKKVNEDKQPYTYQVIVKGIELELEALDFFEYKEGDYVIIIKKKSAYLKTFSNVKEWDWASENRIDKKEDLDSLDLRIAQVIRK